jgi:hypothetical protein
MKTIRRPAKNIFSIVNTFYSWKEGDNPDKYQFVADRTGVTRDFVKTVLIMFQYSPLSKNSTESLLNGVKVKGFIVDECSEIFK